MSDVTYQTIGVTVRTELKKRASEHFKTCGRSFRSWFIEALEAELNDAEQRQQWEAQHDQQAAVAQ